MAGKTVTAWTTLWPMGGVLSASLLIAWATEVLSFFLSRGLAFAILALLQVLPEFAVEAVITRAAALDPSQLAFVSANFTGANRMIVGLFLPFVFFLAWIKSGARLRYIDLPAASSIEVVALLLPILATFSYAVTGGIHVAASVILIALYLGYLFVMYKLPPESQGEEQLPFVPRAIRARPPWTQKIIITAFFLVGGALLFVSVEPFYENTKAIAQAVGISGYFLVQWIAPFLSEFPEFVTIAYWGRTGRAQLAVTNAVSSNINQLTLLIAMIPIVYLVTNLRQDGSLTPFVPFDDSQRLEVLLTAAQALFAASALLNLRFHLWEALTLFVLWAVQLFDPLIDPLLPAHLPHVFAPVEGTTVPHYVREWCSLAFLLLIPFVFILNKNRGAAFPAFRKIMKEHFFGPRTPVDATSAKLP